MPNYRSPKPHPEAQLCSQCDGYALACEACNVSGWQVPMRAIRAAAMANRTDPDGSLDIPATAVWRRVYTRVMSPTPALWLDIDGQFYVLAGGPSLHYYANTGARADLGDYASSGVSR